MSDVGESIATESGGQALKGGGKKGGGESLLNLDPFFKTFYFEVALDLQKHCQIGQRVSSYPLPSTPGVKVMYSFSTIII